MPILTYLGDEYSCATAIKGADYIHLLDEAGVMIAAFDEIKDFSGFKLTNGSYTSPTADHDCYLAVLRDDGTIGRGGHKCSDIPMTAADVGAMTFYSSLTQLGLTKGGETITGIVGAMKNNSLLLLNVNTESDGYNPAAYPATWGLLTIKKAANTRTEIEFMDVRSNPSRFYKKSYRSGVESEWAEVYTSLRKPNAADVGAISNHGGEITDGYLGIDSGGGSVAAFLTGLGSLILRNKVNDGSGNRQEINLGTDRFTFSGIHDGADFEYPIIHTGNLTANGVAKIETGSYVGTGTNGVNHPTEITFSFVPKIVWVWRSAGGYGSTGVLNLNEGYMIMCASLTNQYTTCRYLPGVTNTWHNKLDGTTLSFYYGVEKEDEDTGETYYPYVLEQLNHSGYTYSYFAIG